MKFIKSQIVGPATKLMETLKQLTAQNVRRLYKWPCTKFKRKQNGQIWRRLKRIAVVASLVQSSCLWFVTIDKMFGRHILFHHEAVILLFKDNFSSFKTNIWTRTELVL